MGEDRTHNLYRASTSLLKVHRAKKFPGAVVASLSVPWGCARTDKNRGGYHVVWVRDLVEVAGALMSAGLGREASRAGIVIITMDTASTGMGRLLMERAWGEFGRC